MAQALFNYNKRGFPSVDGTYEAISAGTRHSDRVNPLVVQAMQEIGIDMSDAGIYFPKGLDSGFIKARERDIKRMIVACDESCWLPDRKDMAPEYWDLPDPHGRPIETVREVRDRVQEKVYGLLGELQRELHSGLPEHP